MMDWRRYRYTKSKGDVSLTRVEDTEVRTVFRYQLEQVFKSSPALETMHVDLVQGRKWQIIRLGLPAPGMSFVPALPGLSPRIRNLQPGVYQYPRNNNDPPATRLEFKEG
jgi:hypothetical protein